MVLKRRDEEPSQKQMMKRADVLAQVITLLDEMQNGMYHRALDFQQQHIFSFDDLAKFKAFFQRICRGCEWFCISVLC